MRNALLPKKKWDETEVKQWDPMEDVENLKKKYNTKSTGLISKNMAYKYA